jgi:hypothetical protein
MARLIAKWVVGFADTGRAQEDHVLLALDEAQAVEAVNLLALQGRLEAEVEVSDGLYGGQPGGAHGGLQAAVVAQGDLGTEQRLDGLRRAELPPIDVGEDVIECLECAGHLEIGQLSADALAHGSTPGHRAPPTSSA